MLTQLAGFNHSSGFSCWTLPDPLLNPSEGFAEPSPAQPSSGLVPGVGGDTEGTRAVSPWVSHRPRPLCVRWAGRAPRGSGTTAPGKKSPTALGEPGAGAGRAEGGGDLPTPQPGPRGGDISDRTARGQKSPTGQCQRGERGIQKRKALPLYY